MEVAYEEIEVQNPVKSVRLITQSVMLLNFRVCLVMRKGRRDEVSARSYTIMEGAKDFQLILPCEPVP